MPTLLSDVWVSSEAPAKSLRDGGHDFKWSPCACTLVRGAKSAVLIDTAITNEQNTALADWIESLLKPRGLRLETIYITHGHADHFMGISLLQRRFPGVRSVATRGTVEHMKQQLDPKVFGAIWARGFPNGQLEASPVLAEPLPDSDPSFELEGHKLVAVEVGHTDTYDTTVLWIPDLRLVVAGDVVYGDVHQYLVEANSKEKRQEWIAALEKVLTLGPETVVAGHKRPGGIDSVGNVHNSIEYIQDFQALVDDGIVKQEELFEKMMQKWGGRVNSHALQSGCIAAEHVSRTSKV